MMFYYIDKIEQVDAADDFDWTVNEYGSRTIYKDKTLDEVKAVFFNTVASISNDLKSIGDEKHHYYADLKIVNSDGKIEEKYKLGTRVEPEKRSEPETEG